MNDDELSTTSTTADKATVSVIGLGAMGRALAHAFLDAGHPTTVWNRSAGKADMLVADGAVLADDVESAVSASDVTIICVLDQDVVRELLDPLGEHLHGRTIVNLTSATPELARTTAEWATARGVRYLNGAIMVPTPLIATSDAFFLYSGDIDVFDAHQATLRSLGGQSEFLDSDAGHAALYDLGMLDLFFVGMAGFLHASALMGADGVKAGTFLSYAQRITALLHHTVEGLAADVDARVYPGDNDNLEMEVVSMDHITEASRARGVDDTVPEAVRTLMRGAIADGHGSDGFSRVVDQMYGAAAGVSHG